MIYLASPYSSDSPVVREARFKAVCVAASKLMVKGLLIFSPIAHTHPIAVAGDLPKGWDFWAKYDREFLNFCDEIWVLMLDGWEQSRGVAGEIAIMEDMGKLVKYINPQEL